jgi:pimeloyl-ACP methyl ester carboxylesterase
VQHRSARGLIALKAGRPRPRLVALLVPAVLGGVVAALLTGCSSQAGPAATSTSRPSKVSTSTTTTTSPVPVAGTSLFRARVAPLPPGALALPAIADGSAAWQKMVPVAYRSFGSGPDLLLIAGQDGTLSWWSQTLLSDLSGHYRVTVFDLPGAGYSGSVSGRLSLSWLADMTAGLSLTVGLSDPIVLGWGMGGQIALSLAERHPGLVASLILVDTSAGGTGSVPPATEVVRLLARPGATPVALSTLLFPPTPVGLQNRLRWQSSLFVGTTDWLTAHAVEQEAALQAGLWARSPLVAGLGRVTIPALVVSGAYDVVFPSPNSALLARKLEHATEVNFSRAGYGAIVQDEPSFVAAVDKFAGSTVPTTTTTSSAS